MVATELVQWHRLHLHHHPWGWVWGGVEEGPLLLLVVSRSKLWVDGHLHSGGVANGDPAVGRQLVVVGAVGLEHLHNVGVLSFEGNVQGRAIEVVKEGGVGKDIQKVLDDVFTAFSAGKEQGSLALRWREGGRREREGERGRREGERGMREGERGAGGE